jgi:hypothetical protein
MIFRACCWCQQNGVRKSNTGIEIEQCRYLNFKAQEAVGRAKFFLHQGVCAARLRGSPRFAESAQQKEARGEGASLFWEYDFY